MSGAAPFERPRRRGAAGEAPGGGGRAARRWTVGDVVVDALARAGVGRLYAAGGVLAAALAEPARRGDLPLTAVGAAPTACLMAAVTARICGRPAAVVLSGASTAEAASALAHATLDRAPVIVLADAPGAMSAGVKGTVPLEPASAAHWVAHALQRAIAEPPGPMHVAVTAEGLGAAAVPVATAVRSVGAAVEPAVLDDAAARIAAATRPVAIAGIGCRDADGAAWLRPFAEALPAPVVTTARARGALPDPHPLNVGPLGSTAAAAVLARADLIVALGVDVLETPEATWPDTPVVDVGPAVDDAGRPVALVRVRGAVAAVLEELAPRLRARPRADWDVAELDRLKRGGAPRAVSREAALVALARQALPAGAVAAADQPYAAALSAAWQAVGPHELLAPLAPGVRGFGAAAAVAARLARPAAPAIAFAVPGAATDAALEVAAGLAVPVVAVMLGAGALPRGVPIAQARPPERFPAALAQALGARGPIVLDARE